MAMSLYHAPQQMGKENKNPNKIIISIDSTATRQPKKKKKNYKKNIYILRPVSDAICQKITFWQSVYTSRDPSTTRRTSICCTLGWPWPRAVMRTDCSLQSSESVRRAEFSTGYYFRCLWPTILCALLHRMTLTLIIH